MITKPATHGCANQCGAETATLANWYRVSVRKIVPPPSPEDLKKGARWKQSHQHSVHVCSMKCLHEWLDKQVEP